ncbi:CoxG family protein [Salinigranum sp. GCM10025319]|uniref:CoxG family protein n=1 Tax=Salinigranum sp. GCM10025319 TaxID=3252687 RepID=UPI00360BBBA6
MEFNGTFTIEDATIEEVWLALSDRVMVERCLTGCRFLVEIEDTEDVDFDALAAEIPDEKPPVLPEADPETVAERSFEEGASYAALLQVGVGSVKPTFESIVTIEEREFPTMVATGRGSDSSNSFEMNSGMKLTETDDGDVTVEWWADAEVFGRLAQMGQRVLNPVTNRVVNQFFTKLENQLNGDEAPTGLRGRIRDLV